MKKTMKKTVMLTALILMSAAALFANGSKEADDDAYYGRGNGGWESREDGYYGKGRAPMGICYDEDGNPVELEEISTEGTLVLEEGTLPYLNTAEGRVFLMVPPFVIGELELTGGEAVTVTGYDMPGDPWGRESESVFLKVLSAEVDGEELVMDFNRRGRGHHRSGHPGGRGKGRS